MVGHRGLKVELRYSGGEFGLRKHVLVGLFFCSRRGKSLNTYSIPDIIFSYSAPHGTWFSFLAFSISCALSSCAAIFFFRNRSRYTHTHTISLLEIDQNISVFYWIEK